MLLSDLGRRGRGRRGTFLGQSPWTFPDHVATDHAVTVCTPACLGMIARRTPRKARRPPASGTRNAEPSMVRPNTTIEGGMCSMAMRMNKNELPQMTEVATTAAATAPDGEWPVNDP